ncbi:MAG: hypothetical protein AABY32_01570 [Nanoarchaeota archaeon]
MKGISAEKKKKYIKSTGGFCIYCGKKKLVVGPIYFYSYGIFRTVICSSCKKLWEDKFILSNVVDLVEDEKKVSKKQKRSK